MAAAAEAMVDIVAVVEAEVVTVVVAIQEADTVHRVVALIAVGTIADSCVGGKWSAGTDLPALVLFIPVRETLQSARRPVEAYRLPDLPPMSPIDWQRCSFPPTKLPEGADARALL